MKSKKLFHYTGCALPHVFLQNGYEEVQTPYGKGVRIFALDGLHRALGDAIVNQPLPMIGVEFKFLREELELSQEALGDMLGQQSQTIARWEKGKNPLNPSADRLMRLFYCDHFSSNAKLKPALDKIRELESERRPNQRIKFVASSRSDRWRTEAQAY